MQFYLNGYHPGDPLIELPRSSAALTLDTVPDEVDVLVVGAGPAGMVLAAQLARFPELSTAVVDRGDGPLRVGRADGVARRTLEIFEAFGLAHKVMDEGYWVNEVSFWEPDEHDRTRIVRYGRIPDDGEGLSELPHVVVNQARMLDFLRESMARSASRLGTIYGRHVSDVQVDRDSESSHPVTATLQHLADGKPTGETSTVRAKYVVGCDGARSAVRRAIGRELIGDATDQAWGVMDVLVDTDFPDIRRMCTIYSGNQGNMLIIPREGGYLVRIYIELNAVADRELLAHREHVTPEMLEAVAQRILHPYTLQVEHVGWWSIYEIGQRLCTRFDDVPSDAPSDVIPRVFIAGDACHTHSAKAGQGMNVSMADAWNLGWKIATVLRGTARQELLRTYSQERQAVAQELIDFDRAFAGMFSAPPRGADGSGGVDPREFQRYFVQQSRFTAGVANCYETSMITGEATYQQLAVGYPVGMRFHSAPVVRLADARPLHLGHVARADGAWRLYLFADRAGLQVRSQLRATCEALGAEAGLLRRFTPTGAEPDAVIDVRAIVQQGANDVPMEAIPSVLVPRKGRFRLVDHEKVFCADPAEDIFDARGIDRGAGCMILARPDQHVAHVLPLDAYDELAAFLEQSLEDQLVADPKHVEHPDNLLGGSNSTNRTAARAGGMDRANPATPGAPAAGGDQV